MCVICVCVCVCVICVCIHVCASCIPSPPHCVIDRVCLYPDPPMTLLILTEDPFYPTSIFIAFIFNYLFFALSNFLILVFHKILTSSVSFSFFLSRHRFGSMLAAVAITAKASGKVSTVTPHVPCSITCHLSVTLLVLIIMRCYSNITNLLSSILFCSAICYHRMVAKQYPQSFLPQPNR